MSHYTLVRPGRLEDDRLWRLASEIALYAYAQLADFDEEESYGMEPKLRDRSFDMTNDIAEAVGSVDPRDKTHMYSHALSAAYSVRNVLILANKTGLLQVDPAIFVKLDHLTNGLSDEVMQTSDGIPDYLRQFSVQDKNS